jgi:hypothetical protein
MLLLDLIRNPYSLLSGHPVLPICQMTHYLPRPYRISTFLIYDYLPLGQMLKMAACHFFRSGRGVYTVWLFSIALLITGIKRIGERFFALSLNALLSNIYIFISFILSLGKSFVCNNTNLYYCASGSVILLIGTLVWSLYSTTMFTSISTTRTRRLYYLWQCL